MYFSNQNILVSTEPTCKNQVFGCGTLTTVYAVVHGAKRLQI